MQRGKTKAVGVILTLLMLFLVAIIIFLAYLIYLDMPRAAENLNIDLDSKNPETNNIQIPNNEESKQFYSNMKFNHNKISYRIETGCPEEKKQRMIEAFNELSKHVPKITFYEITTTPDIEILCSQNNNEQINEKHFIAGEGGAKEIIETERFNIITEGIIYLYDNSNLKTLKCDYPNVEIHELMHVFGFEHSKNPKSLMYSLLESCEQKLDQKIISLLNNLYSMENFPDLYFEDAKAIKKGRYLDFNLTIKNSGSIDSETTTIIILEDNKEIDKRELGQIKFGAGMTLQTVNLKLNKLDPKKIEFIIDKDNEIKELDEENNVARIELG